MYVEEKYKLHVFFMICIIIEHLFIFVKFIIKVYFSSENDEIKENQKIKRKFLEAYQSKLDYRL